jgi:predicted HD phosphohydrolase
MMEDVMETEAALAEPGQRASFRRMEESTAADWKVIRDELVPYVKALPDRVLSHLRLLEGDFGGFAVDRLTHLLQTATLALRDGRDEEYVVCALLHDIGDRLGSYNHPDIAAAILKPFVAEENRWMVEKHGLFQAYYFFHHLGMDRNLRDQFRDHPSFTRTAEFCDRYDNPSFDPTRKALPLSEFEPMVRRVFSNPKNTIYSAFRDAGGQPGAGTEIDGGRPRSPGERA